MDGWFKEANIQKLQRNSNVSIVQVGICIMNERFILSQRRSLNVAAKIELCPGALNECICCFRFNEILHYFVNSQVIVSYNEVA